MTLFRYAALCVGVAHISLAVAAVDLGTYKGCPASDAEFTAETIVTTTTSEEGNGPIKLSFDSREGGKADVYFTRRKGDVKKYDGVTKVVTDVGHINVANGNEDGLIGIALDPNFKSNGQVFFFYSYQGTGESSYRISRFKIASGKLDMASEKVLIKIPSTRSRWHTAGSLQFDDYGDLWISVGDNEETEKGPSNTSDMKGGILRIHPDASEKGYSIPKGNFGEVMGKQFRTAGNETLAKQYEDTTKVKAEIYVKGTRNAYSINVDPVRRWLSWGDVGPDQGQNSEEYNFVKTPFYMGWPYFAGSESLGELSPAVKPYTGAPAIPKGISKAAPANNSGSGGVVTLPAVREPIFARRQACAMTGPIFRYDGRITTAGNFPPQFNRKWIISGCDNTYGFHLITLNDSGDAIQSDIPIFSQFKTSTLVDLKHGPDGAMYFTNYEGVPVGKTIVRVSYTGTCSDPAIIPEQIPATQMRQSLVQNDLHRFVKIQGQSLEMLSQGHHSLIVSDLQGRERLRLFGSGPMKHSLAELPENGLFFIRLELENGTNYQSVIPFSSPLAR